jgi:NADH:ubiquinone oxidoreductase subunit E
MQTDDTHTATEHILATRNYPRKPAYLVAALEDIFAQCGSIPDDSIPRLNAYFGLDTWPQQLVDQLFRAKPTAKVNILVCEGPCCRKAGSDHLADELKTTLKQPIGRRHCMGSCDHAPVAMIDSTIVENASPKRIKELL